MSTRIQYVISLKLKRFITYLSSGKKVSEVAQDPGIRHDLISRWRKELTEDNVKAFSGSGNPRDEELARLKKCTCIDIKTE